MIYAVKDWPKFQHFKDRRPTWIKLYRELIDDYEYHKLPAEACKYLILIWLLASEDESMHGVLPELSGIAFRLRLSEEATKEILASLSHYILYVDDIEMISARYQVDILETETELEKSREETEDSIFKGFETDWIAMAKTMAQQKGKGDTYALGILNNWTKDGGPPQKALNQQKANKANKLYRCGTCGSQRKFTLGDSLQCSTPGCDMAKMKKVGT